MADNTLRAVNKCQTIFVHLLHQKEGATIACVMSQCKEAESRAWVFASTYLCRHISIRSRWRLRLPVLTARWGRAQSSPILPISVPKSTMFVKLKSRVHSKVWQLREQTPQQTAIPVKSLLHMREYVKLLPWSSKINSECLLVKGWQQWQVENPP